MAHKYLASLFTFILIFSSLGNIHQYQVGSEESEITSESRENLQDKTRIKSKNLLQHWPAQTLGQQALSLPLQMRSLLLYFFEITHTGSSSNTPAHLMTGLYKTGPPYFFFS